MSVQRSQQSGEPPPPSPVTTDTQTKTTPSWAEIAKTHPARPVPSWAEMAKIIHRQEPSHLPVDGHVIEKLKNSISDSCILGEASKERARLRFQHALYGKLFGKTPPFEFLKTSLLGLWKSVGVVHISDMANGYILIRCEKEEVKEKLLFGGPWTLQGITLQLTPWQPCFEPAFSKLTKAMVWVQLHNLPVDYWDAETLELVTNSIGKLFKIDECTKTLARSRFARVCLEIDLAMSLKRGFWVDDGDHRVFVVVMYEKLPTFCYACGMVGHGRGACSSRHGSNLGGTPLDEDTGGGRVQNSKDRSQPEVSLPKQAMVPEKIDRNPPDFTEAVEDLDYVSKYCVNGRIPWP